MFNQITGLAYGIVTFAIVIGVGTLILYNFGGAVGCDTTTTAASYNTWNATSGKCTNSTGGTRDPAGTAYTNVNYVNTQVGTSGLASWAPAIIAITVGLLFLGAFMGGKGKKDKGRY